MTVCSTWMRGLTSIKNHSLLSASSRNSTVPAFTYPLARASVSAASCSCRRTPSSRFGAGATLDDLLMAALHGAVALVQVADAAVGVGEDLHLDVASPADIALQEDGAVSEGGLRFLLRLFDLSGQILAAVHDPQPPAAAAEGRLDHQREADRPRRPAARRPRR